MARKIHLVSVQIGMPRDVVWRDRAVRTGIWKFPVEGRVRVEREHLAGDGQADLTVHGGRDKAVYVYPLEHYPVWRRELESGELAPGAFGENLTTEGLVEETVRIGDHLRIGTAEFVVTQPRLPCYKLGIRLGRPDIVKRFLRSRRSGFYLAVARQGEIGAGDAIEHESAGPGAVTVAEVVRAIVERNHALLGRAVATPALAADLRSHLREILAGRVTADDSPADDSPTDDSPADDPPAADPPIDDPATADPPAPDKE